MKPSKRFEDLNKVLSKRENIIHKNFNQPLKYTEKIIGQGFTCNEKFQLKQYKKVQKTKRKLTGPKAVMPLVVEKNNHYLIASYFTTKKGLRNPTLSLLRTVFEGITRNYIYYLTKEPARLLYNKDVSNDVTNLLTPKQKKRLQKNYNWLGQSACEKLLYRKNTRMMMRNVYKVLSGSVHPSIVGSIQDSKFNHSESIDTIYFLLALSVANLMQITEIYLDDLSKTDLKVNENLINKASKHMNAFPNLIPDQGRYSKKIRIHLNP